MAAQGDKPADSKPQVAASTAGAAMPATSVKDTGKPPAPDLLEAQERLNLLRAIKKLQEENKTMTGKVASASGTEELKAKNKELRLALEKAEQDLARELEN